MAHTNVVDFEDMRARLLPLNAVQEKLAATEPLEEVTFSAGPNVTATFFPDNSGQPWHKRSLSEPAPVWLQVPSHGQFQLTRQAARQLAAECHIPQNYQELLTENIGEDMLAANVNAWLNTGLGTRELKLLAAGHGVDPDGNQVPLAQAVCRHTLSPFSNVHLLDVMLAGITKKYGEGEVLADYKFTHDMKNTHLRLIIPGHQRIITGTSVHDDTWSLGLDMYNSLTGFRQTQLSGYLFRWWCTNGCVDIANASGGFYRRNTSEEDAIAWASEAVDEILGGLEGTFEQVQALTQQPVTGEVVPVLKGLFREHGVPQRERRRIIETMADTPDLNMYELLSAVTMAANIEGLRDTDVHRLLTMGGHIAHASSGTCSNCHQLLPEGYEQPEAEPAIA